LSWMEPLPGSGTVSYYRIYRREWPAVPDPSVDAVYDTTNSPSYLDGQAFPGLIYNYVIEAVNSYSVAGSPAGPRWAEICGTITGDVNGDGIAGFLDLCIVASAYNANSCSAAGGPSEEWNPNADVDQDGFITEKDVDEVLDLLY